MTKIEYNGSIVATVEGGNTATLPIKDKKMKTDIVIIVPESETPSVEEYDGAIVIEEKIIIGTFTHQYTGGSTASSTFEFEIGMTWAEWIESDYNTSSGTTKFVVNNSGTVVRFGGSGSAILYNGSVACVSTDVILENTTYTSKYLTGGGGSGN